MGFLSAAIVLEPGGILAWLVVGLIAGWLAGRVMRGGGYGVVGDIIVGLLGSFLGGVLMSFLTGGAYGFWGSVLVAFIGACLLIILARVITGRQSAWRMR